jgi:hypothetical protein
MQQRYYDAVAGRFLSVDPVVTDAGTGRSFNRFKYANNSPYSFSDLDGRDEVPFLQQCSGNCQILVGESGSRISTAVTSTTNRSGSVVTINREDGSKEVRSGGSFSWRNNNPGNMKSGVPGFPSIGKNQDFAIFKTAADGEGAAFVNLQTPRYQVLTVGGAIAAWAPGSDGNDPVKYAAEVARWTGLDVGTRMSTLSVGDLIAVSNAIRRYEGWKPGQVQVVPSSD